MLSSGGNSRFRVRWGNYWERSWGGLTGFRDLRFGCREFRLALAGGPGVARGASDPRLYGLPGEIELLDPGYARWAWCGILADLCLIA